MPINIYIKLPLVCWSKLIKCSTSGKHISANCGAYKLRLEPEVEFEKDSPCSEKNKNG